MYDVIIIGGSYAGLSAGLQLARTRRSILVIDAGVRRNRFADESHGFLTQDGSDPADIVASGRAQLMKYNTVDWLDATVDNISGTDENFLVSASGLTDTNNRSLTARKIILATGVSDTLPDISGLTERWGKHIFHCPYCHGYELNQGRIGVLASTPMAMHLALLLPDWGTTILFLNGVFTPTQDQLDELHKRNVTIDYGIIDYFSGEKIDVVMKDGRVISLDGLFAQTTMNPINSIPHKLGCELDESPFGHFIKTDEFKTTSVPGVFACGDTARVSGSIAFAVADGALAGVAAHSSLIFKLV